jgi:molybdopterin-guanine dinucleotide biosynthesis protein A
MPADANSFAAVILAGGRGTRMGGADKGLVEYQGRPLIEWILDAIRPQVDEVLISANRNLETYAGYGCRVVPDTLPDFPGPLAGVLAAMNSVTAEWLLVVSCDTPHLPDDLLHRLLDAAQAENTALAVAADATRLHHTTMLVKTGLKQDLQQYLQSGGRAVRDWQARHGSTQARFDAAHFANYNRLTDWE